MDLYCYKCNQTINHEVRPWQSRPGRFDSLSTICIGCNYMLIIGLHKGDALILPDLELSDD